MDSVSTNPAGPESSERPQSEQVLRERQIESRKFLRGLSSGAYLAACTGEAFAASVVFSPFLGMFSFVNSVMRTRYFQHSPTPVQHTFASLARAGAIGGIATTLRASGWIVGTALMTASLREGFHIGPRFEDRPVALGGYAEPVLGAGSGIVVGRVISRSLSPGARRSVLWLSVGAGALLSDFLGASAPVVRRSLRRLAGESEQA